MTTKNIMKNICIGAPLFKLKARAQSRAIVTASLIGLGCGLGAIYLPQTAQAAPRRKLEIWPGQRVLLVLPLQIGPDWNAGPELGEAIKPLIKPALQQALTGTGKFSVTLPYRFDPIFRRAVADKRITEDVVTNLLSDPSLATAQTALSQLTFEQVPMVAQVQVEELRVGGTPKEPTVQLQMSGKLYEVGGDGPFRNVVVTSRPFGGRTPEARLQAAATDAFNEIARQFVEPPAEFQLPLPVAPAPTAPADGKNPATTTTDNANGGGGSQAVETPNPVASTPNTKPAPNTGAMGAMPPSSGAMAPKAGAPFIPQLPPAQPPLGIAVPTEPTLAR